MARAMSLHIATAKDCKNKCNRLHFGKRHI
jgi:hypothetical protein